MVHLIKAQLHSSGWLKDEQQRDVRPEGYEAVGLIAIFDISSTEPRKKGKSELETEIGKRFGEGEYYYAETRSRNPGSYAVMRKL